MFYFEEIENKKILKSDLIKNAQAFFTTRNICICDKSPCIEVSDELPLKEKSIQNNKEIIAKYLGIEVKNLISPLQTHSSNIELADELRFEYPDTDALILANKKQAIFLNFADCTPIILYDEKQNIGAIAHAGWRGTVQKIAPKTVNKMVKICNSNPKDIVAVIGPAICEKCYEVGFDVYSKLLNSIQENSKTSSNNKYHVNLKQINKLQLSQAGIEKIDVCPYCTCCDNKYFFSYRKENGTSLRHSAVFKPA